MSSMFYGCSFLILLNLNNLNTSQFTSMSCIFAGCKSLTSWYIITDIYYIFSSCRSLTSVDLSKFNTLKFGDMSGMFADCIYQ